VVNGFPDLQIELESTTNRLLDVWVSARSSCRSRSVALNDSLFQIRSGTVFFKARGQNWESLGMPGLIAPGPSMRVHSISAGVSNKSISVFAVASDGGLWYNSNNESRSWSGWRSLGGKLSGLVSVATKIYHVFGVTSEHEIVQISQDTTSPNGWGSWISLGSSFIDLSASVGSDGQVELFAIEAKTAQLAHRYQISADPTGRSWSKWEKLDATVKAISCVRDLQEKLHVFAIDKRDTLIHSEQLSKTEWSKLTSLASGVAAFNIQPVANAIDVLILNEGRYLYKLHGSPPNYADGWIFLADLGSLDTDLDLGFL